MKRFFGAAAIVLTTALTLTACGSGDPLSGPSPGGSTGGGGKVVVGSANFPENVLLASLYAQALKAKGVAVEERPNVGSREVIYELLQNGQLSVLPEYNGGLLFFLDKASTATSTADVDAELKSRLPAGLEILDSSAAQDSDSLTVTKETAAKYGLKTIEDLAKVSGNLVVGGPPEFKQRRERQFKETYGLEFKEWKPTGDTTADAIKDGTVQAGNVFTTDPKILINDMVSLADPKNVFSAQNITPLVNTAAADDTVRTTLNAVSAKLTTGQLVEMMKKLSIDKQDAAAVAKEWLTANGLA